MNNFWIESSLKILKYKKLNYVKFQKIIIIILSIEMKYMNNIKMKLEK